MNSEQAERYSRHISLAEFGEAGQSKINSAKVLVIGAGGLGCPVLQYLAAAGVGTIGIADDDIITLSNLHRQLLYNTADVGSIKAERAAARLKEINPGVSFNEHRVKMTNHNALELIEGYDIIVDGTDNFTTRYLVNDACSLLEKPLVFAGIYRYEGQVAVFNVADKDGNKTNYRHLFPHPPLPEEAPSCRETGVLNVLPGIIGMMQATEVIKLITGIGTPLVNQLLTYNILTGQTYIIELSAHPLPDGLLPADKSAFRNTDYAWLCGEVVTGVHVVTNDQFPAFKEDPNVALIDVRENGELPIVDYADVQLPFSVFGEQLDALQQLKEPKLLVFCQSGVRSLKAARLLRATFGDEKEIYTLDGGIKGLKKLADD